MKINHILAGAPLIAALVFTSGCATKVENLSTTAVADATELVLKEAVYYTTLFNTCASLGDEQEVAAIDKQQDWLNANESLIAAADALYSQKIASSVLNYDNQSISPIAVRLAQQARARALGELSLKNRSPNNQRKTCDFRLAQITPATISLTNDARIQAARAEIMKSAPVTSPDIALIPTLAANIDLSIPPGRTYYTLNKALEKECDTPLTLTLANNWPNEAYANFCENNLVETLICEWGKCEAKKL